MCRQNNTFQTVYTKLNTREQVNNYLWFSYKLYFNIGLLFFNALVPQMKKLLFYDFWKTFTTAPFKIWFELNERPLMSLWMGKKVIHWNDEIETTCRMSQYLKLVFLEGLTSVGTSIQMGTNPLTINNLVVCFELHVNTLIVFQ